MAFCRKKYDLQQHDVTDDKSKRSKHTVYKGLLLAMLSGILHSLASIIVKQMKNLHPGQIAVCRFLGVFAFSTPQAVKCDENLFGPKNLRFLLIIRGMIGATGLFLQYIAYRYLPLGETAVIISSVPVFVTVVARMYLKEPCEFFQFLTVLMTVAGILFAAKIPQNLTANSMVYTNESIYGLLSALGTLIFSTGRFIVLRKLKDVHQSVVMFNCGWVAIIETIILTALVGNFKLHNCGLQSLYIIIIGLLSYVSLTLQTMALQCELAGPVSTIMAAADIVLAFVWQILIFHDIPDTYSSIGAVVVGITVIFVGAQKWVSSLNKESPYRKKLNWMLK